ncbi:MAG: phage holin family protein [Desulfurispora sp.]|uniref:phage holin family protein n=1 Tax=Desulfurispora sp. TaxID=3014275 RepID=UPI0040495B71
MNWLMPFVLSALALLLTGYLVPGIHFTGIGAALVAAVVLAVVNTLLRPLLLVLTLPLSFLTLGIFVLVINGICFALTAALVPGFQIHGFGSAFWGALTNGILNWLIQTLFWKRGE